jgi:hypothetical protein
MTGTSSCAAYRSNLLYPLGLAGAMLSQLGDASQCLDAQQVRVDNFDEARAFVAAQIASTLHRMWHPFRLLDLTFGTVAHPHDFKCALPDSPIRESNCYGTLQSFSKSQS